MQQLQPEQLAIERPSGASGAPPSFCAEKSGGAGWRRARDILGASGKRYVSYEDDESYSWDVEFNL